LKLDDIGFAHGITGKLFCLSNIFAYSKNEKLLEVIKRGIIKENLAIEKRGIENLKPIWCRGTTGIIYGRSLIASNLNQFLDINTKKQLFFYDKKWIHAELTRGTMGGNNMSLCHGIYGNIEIMIKMYKKEKYKKKISKYFNDFEELQWVITSEIPMDLFMLGNTGVAYALLEIVNPQLPSVLALEPVV